MRRSAVLALIAAILAVPLAAFALGSLSVSPDSIAFKARCLRSAAQPKVIGLTNDGDTDVTDVTVRISPSPFSSLFPLSGPTQIPAIPPGDGGSFSVGFVPGVNGNQSARAIIDYRSAKEPTEQTPSPSPQSFSTKVDLSGEGIDRFIDVSPRALNFGDRRLGQSAPSQVVTVFDDGDSPLTVTSITMSGRNAGDFTVAPRGQRTITDGSPLRLTVGFIARGAGARIATLNIKSNSCSGGTATVQLAGVGVVQDIVVLPERVDFAPQRVGARETRPVTIANQGGTDLRVTSVTLAGRDDEHFRVLRIPTFPRSLAPGESFELRARFVADEVGDRKASILVESNDPDTPKQKVELRATAAERPPEPTPTLSDPAPLATSTIPPDAPAGEGFLAAYAGEMALMTAVVGFFMALVIIRRIRGIPE